ncbi:TPA: hypothetical protein ACVU44_004742 [Vibrio parahaemolyticus]|uniref:hypothetical protein n=1 Tax=Vibrio parahaemolyticus TaxID=670 RepID=UPI0017869A94|nr:hypothetical protein [Vibrio parahaemolyticus]MBD6969336.1 hypothetical protein [Vibrio parahaemolyticus]MBD6973581.1 hypothetical protein [Vibrio parahaemolyticus]
MGQLTNLPKQEKSFEKVVTKSSKVSCASELQQKEFDYFMELIRSEKDIDKTTAMFLLDVSANDSFNNISEISKALFNFLPRIAHKMRSNNMEAEAFMIEAATALFKVCSVDGVLSDRVTTEQNRKAQNERHNRAKQEIVPLMDELIHNIKHPVTLDTGVDLFLNTHPEIERPYSTIKKLFKERREHLGYPSMPPGRPSAKNL